MDRLPCRLCGQMLLWVRSHRTGSLLSLDAEECERGDVTLVAGVAHVANGDLYDEVLSGPRYRQHDCPKRKKGE